MQAFTPVLSSTGTSSASARRPATRCALAVAAALATAAAPALAQTAPPVQPGPPPAAAAPAQPGQAPAQGATPAGAPACDDACVRQNSERIALACAPQIERQAPTDFDWILRPYPGIFQQAVKPDDQSPLVRYRGDSIRFLSPTKEWTRVTYECGMDPVTQQLKSVNVRLGRLDRPPPPAPTAAAPRPGAQPQAAGQAAPPRPAAPQVVRRAPAEGAPTEVRQVDPTKGKP